MSPRRPLVLAAVAVLALVVAAPWLHEALAGGMRRGPDAERLLGDWTFDRAAWDADLATIAAAPAAPGDGVLQARREALRRVGAAWAGATLRFAADHCRIDRGGVAIDIPCRYRPEPPDGIAVESSDPQRQWRMRAVLDPERPGAMRWSDEAGMAVPMRRP